MPRPEPPAPDGYVTTPRDRLTNSKGVNFGTAILVFVAADTLVIVALVGALQPAMLPIVLPAIVGLPFLIFGFITQLMWAPLSRRFPPRPQAPDAVVKTYQSLAIGRLSRINNFVHIAADADHLHFIAPGIMRMTGAKVISVPWERFTDVKQKGLFGMTNARLDGRPFSAPTWCMQVALAQAGADSTKADSDGSRF